VGRRWNTRKGKLVYKQKLPKYITNCNGESGLLYSHVPSTSSHDIYYATLLQGNCVFLSGSFLHPPPPSLSLSQSSPCTHLTISLFFPVPRGQDQFYQGEELRKGLRCPVSRFIDTRSLFRGVDDNFPSSLTLVNFIFIQY
jgi:hypothetical protein